MKIKNYKPKGNDNMKKFTNFEKTQEMMAELKKAFDSDFAEMQWDVMKLKKKIAKRDERIGTLQDELEEAKKRYADLHNEFVKTDEHAADLSQQVEELKKQLQAQQQPPEPPEPAYNKPDAIGDSYFYGNISKKRDDAIVLAKQYCQGHVERWKGEQLCSLIANVDGRTITTLVVGNGSGRKYKEGVSKCHPDDTFNKHIGMALAMARMWKDKNAEAYFSSIPNRLGKNAKVGNLVKGMVSGDVGVIEKMITNRYGAVRNEDGELYSKFLENCIVLDDTEGVI